MYRTLDWTLVKVLQALIYPKSLFLISSLPGTLPLSYYSAPTYLSVLIFLMYVPFSGAVYLHSLLPLQHTQGFACMELIYDHYRWKTFSFLCVFLPSCRTSTNLRLIKKKCISGTSISFVTCICRLKTTQVSERVCHISCVYLNVYTWLAEQGSIIMAARSL